MKAIRLQTENLYQPIGLGNVKPRFGWNCLGGTKQTAYRIVCTNGNQTVWDSGKVDSSRMTYIPYEGEPLQSRDRIDWAVTLWDEAGCAGEPAGAVFEMGLLKPSDWKAEWITGAYRPKAKLRYPVDCFRKQLSVKKPIQRARLYASARGIYTVSVNGKRIKDFIFAPGMTDYRKRIQYQIYDITTLVSEDNTLELWLADGWYRGSSAAYGVTNVYGTQTSVIAQLELTYTDGSCETVVTDETWEWSNDGPVRYADLKDGEDIDARLVPGYGSHAITVKAPDAPLVASDNVPVREKERFTAKPIGNGVYDLGQNLAGYLSFTVRGRKGEALRFICGEDLDENGCVDQSNFQLQKPAKGWTQLSLVKKMLTNQVFGDTVPTPRQEIRFICSGGTDEYETRFSVFGFRYIQMTGHASVSRMGGIAVYSDMEETGTFSCSDPLVNRLVENTRWSMKSNFLDLPSDCPTRERLGWTGDAQVFFQTGAYLMNTAPFFRKWLRDMADAQYKDGLIPAVLPYQGVEMMYKSTGTSVGWADAIYLIPYRFYLCYGDRALLKQTYPMMRRYVEYLLSHRGLTDRKAAKANPHNADTYEKGIHLGEWLEPEEFRDTVYGARARHPEECTAYLHLAMNTMAKIADLLDQPEDAGRYRKAAEGAKEAYYALFVKTGTLDTDRQAKLVRPLALGLLDGEEKRKAEQRLVLAAEHFNYCVGTGFLSTPFLLPVLTDAGETDTAYKILQNTEKPGWLGEVKDGATTVWETWEGNTHDPDSGSLNHYSPGAVCEWLFSGSAGIRISGEKEFMIAPHPGGTLTYAAATYRSIYGSVESRWERTERETVYTVTIPANTVATICLPDGSQHKVEAGTHRFTETH